MIIEDVLEKEIRNEKLVKKLDTILVTARMYDALSNLIKAVVGEKRKASEAFVVILGSAKSYDVKTLFMEEKRFSDILVEIDAKRNVYALVCLDTKVEGGFHFAQRLLRHIKTGFGEKIHMVVADVRNNELTSEEVLNTIVSLYKDVERYGRFGEVVLHSMR